MIVFEHPTRTTNLDQLKATETGAALDADPLCDWKLCTWLRLSKREATYWLRSGRTTCTIYVLDDKVSTKFSTLGT